MMHDHFEGEKNEGQSTQKLKLCKMADLQMYVTTL
jgi:hypothetical protein